MVKDGLLLDYEREQEFKKEGERRPFRFRF